MGTGAAVATGDLLTAAKMNLKQEDGRDMAAFGLLDQSGAGTEELLLDASENLTADRTLTLVVNDAARTVDLRGNLTLAAALTTAGANALTLTTTGATDVTLPTTGTLSTLDGTESLTAKTLASPTFSGTAAGAFTLSGSTITLTGGTLNLTAGAAYALGTTDAFALNLKTNNVNKLALTTTLGQFTVYQATANVTLAVSDPAAARTITFADPGGNDNVVYAAASQSISNKTYSGGTFSGTFAGTPTLTGATYNWTAAAAVTIGTTDANTLALKTNDVAKLTLTTTLGQFTVHQTTANLTLAFSDPGAARTITFPDPGGADSVVYLAATQSLSGKTLGATTLAGTLSRAADQTIDLTGAATRTLTITNSTASQVTNLDVDGVLILRNNTAFTATLTSTPTANRTITFQDVTGTLYVGGGTDVLVADGGTGLSAWTANSLCYASAATTLASLGAATDGQIPVGSTGAAPVLAALTGTANQVVVTNGAGTITLSTPQSIATASTPTFGGLTLDGDLTFSAALDIEIQAATAAALQINVGANYRLQVDTRTTTDGIEALSLSTVNCSFASAAGSSYNSVVMHTPTITLTGGTGVTAMDGLTLRLNGGLLTSASGTTVTTASTLYLAPVVAGGSVTITNNRMINTSVAGCFLTAAGVWTDASSEEHKLNIKPVSLGRIPKLLDALRVVSYQRRHTTDGGFERFGVVAEEAPDFLAEPQHKGIAAQYMAGFALAAIKWLRKENQELKGRVAALELRPQGGAA